MSVAIFHVTMFNEKKISMENASLVEKKNCILLHFMSFKSPFIPYVGAILKVLDLVATNLRAETNFHIVFRAYSNPGDRKMPSIYLLTHFSKKKEAPHGLMYEANIETFRIKVYWLRLHFRKQKLVFSLW